MNNEKSPKEPTEKQKLGRIGEDYACEFLKDKGYSVTERNYLRKWGELDIVCKKSAKIHFIEVKSVSRDLKGGVIHETNDEYRPEDNMHPWKLKRLSRAVQSYLLEKNLDDVDWQFDVVTVYVDLDKGLKQANLIEDIVL